MLLRLNPIYSFLSALNQMSFFVHGVYGGGGGGSITLYPSGIIFLWTGEADHLKDPLLGPPVGIYP